MTVFKEKSGSGFGKKTGARKYAAAALTASCALGLIGFLSAGQTSYGYAVYPDTSETPVSVDSTVSTGNNFSRSSGEWDSLKDNTLLWDEIPSLIHEYNAAVVTNRSEMNKDERKSMDAKEVSDYLLDKADDYDADADEAAETSAVLAATYRSQANTLRQQADSNLDDFEVIKLGYGQTEKQTALSAKTQFLDYFEALDQKEYNSANIAYLERSYASAVNMRSVNMATELEVLSAKEALEEAKASAVTTDNSVTANYQSLIVLCGWKYDADAVIGDVPLLSAADIIDVDYASDMEKAREANITLKTDNIRLNNARSFGYASLVTEQETQLKSDTDSFGISFKAAYDSLVTAAASYTNAANSLKTGESDLANSKTQHSLGMISDVELAAAENTYASLKLSERSAYYDMILARATYDAAVNDGIL